MLFAIKSSSDIIFYDSKGKEKYRYKASNFLEVRAKEIDDEKRVFVLFNGEMVDYDLLNLAYNTPQEISDFNKEQLNYRKISIRNNMNTEELKMIVTDISLINEYGSTKDCKIVVDKCKFVNLENIIQLSNEAVSSFNFALECFIDKEDDEFVQIYLEQ